MMQTCPRKWTEFKDKVEERTFLKEKKKIGKMRLSIKDCTNRLEGWRFYQLEHIVPSTKII